MAGGAASSAAPTKNERDEMQRAIKFRLWAWPATIRPTPDRSARLTRGLRPWKGIDWSIVVHSRLRKPNKPNRTGHLCIHLTTPVLSRQSTSADQYRRQIKLGRYVKNKRAAASRSIALYRCRPPTAVTVGGGLRSQRPSPLFGYCRTAPCRQYGSAWHVGCKRLCRASTLLASHALARRAPVPVLGFLT